MGFTTGFTGGVTLTLAVAYLSVAAHQRNRQAQGAALRTQASLLSSLAHHDDPSARTPQNYLSQPEWPSSREIPGGFVETAKARWNAEVEGAVRWAQEKDWDAVREDAEDVAARAWRRAFGGQRPIDDGVADVAGAIAGRAREGAEEVRGKAAGAARGALESTRAAAARAADAAGEKAEEARGAIARGVEKGKGLVGRASAAAAATAQELETAAAGTTARQEVSDVERVLQQRFEKRDPAIMDRTVKEVLSERYKPIDRRDNTVLRGI